MKRASLFLLLVLSGVVLSAAPAGMERKVSKPYSSPHSLLCGTPLLRPLLPFALFGRSF